MADKFQLKALITGVDKLSPMLKGVGHNAGKLRKQLESSGLGKISMGDIVGGGAFAMPFIAGAKAAIAFESKMADVKKVMDFDAGQETQQFAALHKDVLSLSRDLPMAAEGIAAIYAAGGQSGIARGELKGFATDAIKMSVAFDQTADESGKMMATWRTSFRMGQGDVVALADKINYLGNTGPATTKQISGIVTKIGPLGEVAGLASGQIAAMGATLAGVGVQEEVAATGMKNFMLALTAGSAATKAQSDTFKALRLDSKQVAEGMQKDSEGTILKVLQAIGQVDKSKQAAVLTKLFGKESQETIVPMLTNLDLLQGNFRKVADAQAYAGSMEKEYASRAATTENNLQLLQNRTVEVGIAIGSALLPAINDGVGAIAPLVSWVADLASANPWLIKGLLGAAAGFVGLRVAVMGTALALKLVSTIAGMSPVGLLVRGIALAAGFLIANWSSVAPFFKACWDKIKEYAAVGWEIFKAVAGFSPLGLIVKNWEPIAAFFKQMWERIRPFVEPIMSAGKWVGAKVAGLVGGGAQAAAPVAASGTMQAPAKPVSLARPPPAFAAPVAVSSTMQAPAKPVSLAARPPPAFAAPVAASSPVQAAKSPLPAAAAAQKQQVQGELVVRFDNPPPGLQVQSARTNQPGFDINAPVGTRSLSLPY